jgi:hypothetical protein
MRFVGCALIGLGSVESEFQSYLLGLARGRLEQSTSPVDIARFHLVQSASMLGIIAGIGILIVGLTIINRRAFSLDVQSGRCVDKCRRPVTIWLGTTRWKLRPRLHGSCLHQRLLHIELSGRCLSGKFISSFFPSRDYLLSPPAAIFQAFPARRIEQPILPFTRSQSQSLPSRNVLIANFKRELIEEGRM